uniref:Uncharacterized protein n=1 Tax=Vitis vinifera TaxID=29760 RepID=F6HEK6_VITVI
MPRAQTPPTAHANVHSREELDILLERFPTFINIEPSSHMNKLFPMLERILVDVIADPQQNFMACVPHGTTNETIEAIMHLKNYTTMQKAEVKHDIIDDILSIPSDEENEVDLGEKAGQGDDSTMGDKSAVTGHDDQDTT